ncbi:MAG: HAD family phosphatase [Clostridia bacterium]|nr:HAD family phosphatase [Clostridia bacterium]MBQ1962939.1 HAD family phosphatase [Clostridia bacterium]
MQPIQAVLFDMDGTVFDSERVYRDGFLLAAKEMGLPPSVIDHHPALCGLPRDESRRYMKSVFGTDFPYDDWRERMWQYAAEVFLESGPPKKDGVPEILIELRDMGIRTAIATATRLPVATQYLQKSGLAPYFDTVVTGDRVRNGKPAPDIFLLAAEELGIPPASCAVAEDSRNGILAAHRAGCYPILVPDLYPPAAEILPLLWHRAESLWQIPAFVRQHNQPSEQS